VQEHRLSYRDISYWHKYQPYLPEWLAVPPDAPLQEEWWTWRQGEIHLDRLAAEEAPLTVILLHGGGGYGRLLAPFGTMLRREGYEVVAPDLPGYGLSRVPQSLVGHDLWVECAADLVKAEQSRAGRSVVLFGFSLGGYVAYLAAAKCRTVAGIAATTLADPRIPQVQTEFARHPLLSRLGLPLLPVLDRLCGRMRFPIQWVARMQAISNDPELVSVFLEDRCGAGKPVSVHFMRSLFETRPDIEPEEFDVCPVLLAHPGADRWTTVEASRLFFDRIKAPKRLVLLDHCGHFPIEEPGISRLREAVVSFLAELVSDVRESPGEALRSVV